MDNGLIFPYRRKTVKDLTSSAKQWKLSGCLRAEREGKLRTRTGVVSVLTGVTQEGRCCRAMVVPV